MKSQFRCLVIACLLSLSFVSLVRGQEATSKTSSSRATASPIDKRAPVMSPEEKVVRAAYEKLTMLSKAALLIKGGAVNESPDDDLFLRFALSNFRVGPIQEILSALHSELITGATGEIIMLTRGVTQLNKEEEHVAYEA